jgi:putative tryptophan/tyrosine transport system substrate-binding protein
MNRHRRLLLLVAASVCAAPLAGHTEQPTPKAKRIGILSPESGEFAPVPAFRQELHQLGWFEGKSLVIDHRWANGRYERLPELMAELLTTRADVIYAIGPDAARIAKDATRAVPIVALDLETDPVASGFVRTLGRPEGNLTGLFLDVPELFGKWLQLIREVAPSVRSVGAVGAPTINAPQFAAVESLFRNTQLRLHRLEVHGPADFGPLFEHAVRVGTDAIFVFPSPLVFHHGKQIAQTAAKNRLPAIYMFRHVVEAGGLMSYGPNVIEMSKRAASLADKILKGAKPAEVPVERPTRFDLVINVTAAKALGINIPASLLLRADEVIQ